MRLRDHVDSTDFRVFRPLILPLSTSFGEFYTNVLLSHLGHPADVPWSFPSSIRVTSNKTHSTSELQSLKHCLTSLSYSVFRSASSAYFDVIDSP